MTNEFPRLVAGYNIPRICYAGGSVDPASTVVLSITDHPGEVMGITIFKTSGSDGDFFNLVCKIEVDGVVIYNNVWRDLVLMNTQYAAHGHFGTHDIQTANQYASASFYCRMSFEASFVVTLSAVAGGAYFIMATIPYRYAG